MSSYVELISQYPQIHPGKFGLRPAPMEATQEMINTAEKVVYALVTARYFGTGFGCDCARDGMLKERNLMLNCFVDVAQKSPQSLNPQDLKWIEANCKNLAYSTDVPIELINQYAKFSGYDIDWHKNSRIIINLHPTE
jgi:hypothetical protein